MVADDLALRLAREHVRAGDSVLDPFCGSGRLLAASASQSVHRVGVDANPLAWLLTSAKLSNPDPKRLRAVLEGIPARRARKVRLDETAPDDTTRRVEWFPSVVLDELSQIIAWINSMELDMPERLVAAAALSAAARDASYARRSGWKLHRMSEAARTRQNRSGWDCFERRLRYCTEAIAAQPEVSGECSVHLGDTRRLLGADSEVIAPGSFDVVLTSPPYGDSRTTVQYGAASALCIDIASRISGLEALRTPSAQIDGLCLGGYRSSGEPDNLSIKDYWSGSKDSPRARSVGRFLWDYAAACAAIASRMRPKGTVVMIVGRRSVEGFRLKLDDFTVDQFESLGFRSTNVSRRHLVGKRLPRKINRFGRASSVERRALGVTTTMLTETIVVLRRDGSGTKPL